MLTAVILSAVTLGSTVAQTKPSPPLVKQLIVIRGAKATRVAVSLVPGDHVAVLTVTSPPASLMQTLQQQVGQAMVGVERIKRVGNTMTVALYLASEAFGLRVRRLRRKRGSFSILISPKPYLPTLAPHTLIGRVPDTPPRPAWPLVVPDSPKRHPCLPFPKPQRLVKMLEDATPPSTATLVAFAQRMTDRECRDFFMARVAAALSKSNRDLTPLKGWAFQFSRQDRWISYPFAYSYTALVASALLLRASFLPEAEAMLATDRIQPSPRLRNYRALLMSDLLLLREEKSTAQQLLRAIFREREFTRLRDAAALRLVDLANAKEPDAARWVLDNIVGRLSHNSPLYNRVASRAGELALSMGDRKTAKRLFSRAINSKAPAVRGHALLRLGDIAVRQWRPKATKTALAFYEKISRHQRCLVAMARLRTHLLDNRDRELLEQNVMDSVEQPQCEGHRIESRYAMAKLSAIRDQFSYAIQLLEEGYSNDPSQEGSRATFDELISDIAAQSVGRLTRNRQWKRIAELYRDHLVKRLDSLSTSTRLLIADALNRVGLNKKASMLIRTTLKTAGNTKLLDDLTLVLARSYLDGNQLYLAEVVLDYFRRVRSRSERLWEVQLTQAELLIRQGAVTSALQLLQSAEKSTPGGDPQARLLLLRAEADYRLGNAERAASALIKTLQQQWHPPLDTRGRGVNVLSLCVRKCSKPKLERLLKTIKDSGQDALLTERIRYLSGKRGVGSKPKPGEASVWKRLEAVAPGIKVGRGRPKGGSR